MTRSLKGVIAAVVTPLTPDGSPDASRLVQWAGHLLASGCDGLNLLGTTGEATSFSLRQRLALMEAVARSSLPLDRFMVGTGAASVDDAAALTRAAGDLGFSGALLLPPFYYKNVPDEGVLRYFDLIVARTRGSEIPLYLYNFPLLSGVPYTPGLVTALASRFQGRIRGLKDSSGDLDYARTIAGLPFGLDVFPSDEACLTEARTGIFAGCISATANVNSVFCGQAYGGDSAAQATASAIRALFAGRQLVPAVKAIVAEVTRDPGFGEVLPPFTALKEADCKALTEEVRALAGPPMDTAFSLNLAEG